MSSSTARDFTEFHSNKSHPNLTVYEDKENAQIVNHNLKSIQYNNSKIMTQLFHHLHRPLPSYFRSRQFNTKEWFLVQTNDILLEK
ncbi:unnamed protein product [Adineta steineri]|uniref:Uncharacterized protein n=1 Tax=Adineta steineri TaxID=433720 RepID=A0A820F2F7_9BILA|nr:unnamed protein product [Adineta steineri]CAF4254778.1 unnamed protein product [Adineta steineri]CAF4274466.1 unnamed protein product [Adineta steineri]